MSLERATGVLSAGTGAIGTTYSVTGLTFQPKLLILWAAGRNDAVDATGRTHLWDILGVAVSATKRWCVYGQAQNALGTSDTSSGQTNLACFATVSIADAQDGALDLQSFNADGFTLVVDDVLPRAVKINWLALGGTDITDVEIGTLTMPASAGGTSVVSSLSFQPDLVLVGHGGSITAAVGATTTHRLFFGAAHGTGATEQAAWGARMNNAAASGVSGSASILGEIVAYVGTPTTVSIRGQLTALAANGFTITWPTTASGTVVHWLALKGPRVRVGALTTSTVLNNTYGPTGLPFQPKAGMIWSHNKAATAAGAASADAALSMGFFDGTNQYNQTFYDRNGNTAMFTSTVIRYSHIYANTEFNGTVEGHAQLTSINADGFTITQTDADPVAAQMIYLVFGDAPIVGGFDAKKSSFNLAIPF